ncbi:hypothetical protein CDL15_Pgr012127 [Punica granatum]|uniref:FAS1 domain-containing protein n=1 Tax=Punica granatum TaxID=22663 RepID=A0A218XLK6_PUNGR|nr:hypothetical protein CDL15_Pgr012127 [Punica granatum]
MQLCGCGHLVVLLPLLLLSAFAAAPSRAHNITALLAKHLGFSTFSNYLTQTHLADEISARTTITVLAVDDDAMSGLLASHPTLGTIKNILSLHVLLDYFGTRKLHQLTDGSALVATLFQASGSAPGSTGFVNITNIKGGKVALGPQDNGGVLDVYFVKSLEEIPYNISVLQISKILPSAEAAAPAPDPAQTNLTALMSGHGCKEFADTLSASPHALNTYKDNVVGGLTMFCPSDGPFKAFQPRFDNLTTADRVSFLEFYGVPVYMSISMLQSNNGPMNTLATDGPKKFGLIVQNDGEEVTLKTKVNTVKTSGTIFDQQPLAIYSVDGVLLPEELSEAVAGPVLAPTPAPEKAADTPDAANSPKAPKHQSPPAPTSANPPADSPDGGAADESADGKSSSPGFGNERIHVVVLALFSGAFLL